MAVTVMQRYEMKYLLNERQTVTLQQQLDGHMKIDQYGLTSIASLYYDTPDARLIRASLDNQEFKEKLRLRSYGLATNTSPVYLELKRKFDGVVYKRRVQSTIPEIAHFFSGADTLGTGQIPRELGFFRNHYEPLAPACLIIYDRAVLPSPWREGMGLAADSGWGAAETLVGFTMQMERSLCYSKVLGCPSFAHS